MRGRNTVTFVNHGYTKSGLPDPTCSLPDPKFFAIHAAIAHVLKLTAAGEVLDKVLDTFFDEGHSVPAGKTSGMGDLELRLFFMDFAHSSSWLQGSGAKYTSQAIVH